MNIGTAVIESTGLDILDKITAERIYNKEHTVTSSSKLDDSGSGPEEAPILHESSGVQKNNTSSVSTCVESECHEHKNTTENPRKRRRHHKHNSFKKVKSSPNEERQSVCYEKKSLDKSSYVRWRKLTLLEKVNKVRHYAKSFLRMCGYKLSVFIVVCIPVSERLSDTYHRHY
jgi:hypothetical protein